MLHPLNICLKNQFDLKSKEKWDKTFQEPQKHSF
jgi:hypothetical protein